MVFKNIQLLILLLSGSVTSTHASLQDPEYEWVGDGLCISEAKLKYNRGNIITSGEVPTPEQSNSWCTHSEDLVGFEIHTGDSGGGCSCLYDYFGYTPGTDTFNSVALQRDGHGKVAGVIPNNQVKCYRNARPTGNDFPKVGDGLCLDQTGSNYDRGYWTTIISGSLPPPPALYGFDELKRYKCGQKCLTVPSDNLVGMEFHAFPDRHQCTCLYNNGMLPATSYFDGSNNNRHGEGRPTQVNSHANVKCYEYDFADPLTAAPTSGPTSSPTSAPTSGPTSAPTSQPTSAPTSGPTSGPSQNPSSVPTFGPPPLFEPVGQGLCLDSNGNNYDRGLWSYNNGAVVPDEHECGEKCGSQPNRLHLVGMEVHDFETHGVCACLYNNGQVPSNGSFDAKNWNRFGEGYPTRLNAHPNVRCFVPVTMQ